MRFERDDQKRDWTPENDGQWTKEEAKRDPRFDFAAFLGPDNLDDMVTDAADGKDLLDKDAYGEFAPGYVRRRGAPGERGRHELPGQEPEEEEEQFDDGYQTRRFSGDGDFPEDEEPDFQEEPQQKPSFVDEPPPRPKVVVAQPAPTVYVDPHTEYGPEEPQRGGNGMKWIIALLIAAVIVVGALVVVTMLLPGTGGTPAPTEEPAATDFDILSGLLRPRPTQAPAAAPTVTPEPAPPAVKTYAVTVTAGSGGRIEPSGRVSVQEGGSASFAIIPDGGYELGQLLIDGSNVSVQDNYTFSDVRGDHSIYAVFQPSATMPPPPTVEPTAEPTQEPVITPEPPPPAVGEVGDLGPEAME